MTAKAHAGSPFSALPPPMKRNSHPAEAGLAAGVRWSFGLHAAVLLFVVIKSLVFPGKPVTYLPSLRVDIVGLPDVLKKDMASLSPAPPPLTAKEERTEPPAPKAKPEAKADPDEMVLKPKKADPKAEAAERQKKLKSALARIKALDKIADSTKTKAVESPANASLRGTGPLIKGNAISRGTSLDGAARESAEASYFDSLRERLRENWLLPVWLARQRLSAQIMVFIDGRGTLRGFTLVRSSGNAQFDEAVRKTISQSQPFPVPPETIAGRLATDGVLVGFPL
ncbi:MAG: cell envelope integrity protein TolA [Oligoflexia bacterium]|nr:cell envelope integrity protein TolA [Oligoflexia bacterium]